jgi:uncharacterized protein (DUF736 family)
LVIFLTITRRTPYFGTITTLTLQRGNVVLRPTNKSAEREPDYRIVQEDESGTVEFGAAWKRSSGQRREFLSIVLDDPALPSALNGAMFHSDRDGSATLVWQRPQKRAPVTDAEVRPAHPPRSSSKKSPPWMIPQQ